MQSLSSIGKSSTDNQPSTQTHYLFLPQQWALGDTVTNSFPIYHNLESTQIFCPQLSSQKCILPWNSLSASHLNFLVSFKQLLQGALGNLLFEYDEYLYFVLIQMLYMVYYLVITYIRLLQVIYNLVKHIISSELPTIRLNFC